MPRSKSLPACCQLSTQAGQAAAATIRKGFNDGLTDSGWDRFKYAFKKFLQILIKVLTYIGMALAVIALVIPGVGEMVLAAGIALGSRDARGGRRVEGPGRTAPGPTSASAIAGLLTFGAAKVLGPAIQAGMKSITSAVRGADAADADGTVTSAPMPSGAGSAAKSDAEVNTEIGRHSTASARNRRREQTA